MRVGRLYVDDSVRRGFEKKRNLKKEAGDEVTNEARLPRSFFKSHDVCGLGCSNNKIETLNSER